MFYFLMMIRLLSCFLLFFQIQVILGQQLDAVDFLKLDAKVQPFPENKAISGTVSFLFKVKKEIDTIKIDAQNMKFYAVFLNGKAVNYKNSGKQLLLFEGFKKGKNKLIFSYEATPKQTLYFTGTNTDLQIWTQGQGKYTSHWLPSFDDVNEKLIFNISIVFDASFQVLSNGVLKAIDSYPTLSNPNKTWHFEMKKPMSSYLAMLAIGNFAKQTAFTKSKTPLEFYLAKEDSLKFEPTYRFSKEIFDYLETEIGVNYPWKIYRQVPVRDFLYAGMENTTTTIFAQDFVVDSIGFNDRNYINVNAHELAHQWFGDIITAQSSKQHWLQEGFATYYALLAEQKVFGEDYFYQQLLQYAEQLKAASKTDFIPILDEKASSLTFYRKGAWALHVLREDIGAAKFQKIIKKYLKKYAYKNVNTDDFLKIVKRISDYDIENFKRIWLEKPGFEMEIALNYLKRNKAISEYLKLRKSKHTITELIKIINSDAPFYDKQFLIYQTQKLPFEERKLLLEAALNSQNYAVRQAVAATLPEIPSDFQSKYETLLNDNSYKTKEIALQNLCSSFPEKCTFYLEQTKGISGNNDKNVQLTWLQIALNLPETSVSEKEIYFAQLLDFASEKYESSIRQNALELLLPTHSESEKVMELLVAATQHHKWQFTKFARDTIRKLLKKATFREKFIKNASNSSLKLIYQKYIDELNN